MSQRATTRPLLQADWSLPNTDHRRLLGDARLVLATLPTSSVDLIITSPPYGQPRRASYGGIAPQDYVSWFLHSIGIDLQVEYVRLARERLAAEPAWIPAGSCGNPGERYHPLSARPRP